MDNFAYLNQISQSTRPAKSANPMRKFSIAKIAAGGIVLFFLIMAFGALLGSLNQKPTELTKQLYLRSTNLRTTINNTNSYLKTSQLRAINASLSSVLSNTNNQLATYLIAHSKDEDDALIPKDSVIESETALNDELNQSLLNARLNGILDRVYDTQINLQVSLLLSMISELASRNKDPELNTILATFHSSLTTIQQSLENYSNPGD